MKIFLMLIFVNFIQAESVEYKIDTFCQDYNVVLTKLNLYNANIANVNTTRTVEGGPYKAKEIKSCYKGNCEVITVKTSPLFKYEPESPDANEQGYVAYPNINIQRQMKKLIKTQRVLEAVIENIPVSSKEILLGNKLDNCFKKFPIVKEILDYKVFLGR